MSSSRHSVSTRRGPALDCGSEHREAQDQSMSDVHYLRFLLKELSATVLVKSCAPLWEPGWQISWLVVLPGVGLSRTMIPLGICFEG